MNAIERYNKRRKEEAIAVLIIICMVLAATFYTGYVCGQNSASLDNDTAAYIADLQEGAQK